MARKLSADEREVLLWLMLCHEAIERDGGDTRRREARTWGVPWDGTIGFGPARAVAAATLRRLEERGLVRRRTDDPSEEDHARARFYPGPEPRTTHLRLTDAGRYLVLDLRRAER
jgi:hypothetical protein